MKSYSISQRKKSLGNLTWYGRTFDNGVLISEISLKTKRKSDALAWLDMMNASRFMPEDVRKKIERRDADFKSAIPKFLDSVSASKGPDSKTYLAYSYRLNSFTKWLDERGIRTLGQFENVEATDYAKWLSERYAPKSLHEMIRCTSQFCQWAARIYRIADYDPFDGVTMPKVPKRSKSFWTSEQIDRILDNAPTKEFRLFWSLMAFAGLRHAEACSFGPSSIIDGRIRVVGKGNKEAFVPIGRRLENEMENVEIVDGMFSTAKYKKSERCMDTLRCAVRCAGLDDTDATNHKFRHSFISNLIRAGVNVRAVQQLARHEGANVTLETYSHLLQDDLKESVDKL